MQALISLIEQLPGAAMVRERLAAGETIRAAGLGGSARALLAAGLFRGLHRTMLIVCPSTRAAEEWYSDLHLSVRGETDDLAPPLRLFPSLPTLLYGDVGLDAERVGQRLDTMEALLRGEPTIVVAPLSALLHRTIPPTAMQGSELHLEVGQTLAPERLIADLTERGYTRHEPVLMAGQCALRGGIVDVYPITAPQPLRVEFWGDEIESIRYFDVNSQRSTRPQERFTVTVSRESIRTRALDAHVVAEIADACERQATKLAEAGRTLEAKRLRARVTDDLRRLEGEEPFDGSDHYLPYLYDEVATLIDYLPSRTLVLVDEPDQLAARAEALREEVGEVYRAKLSAGALLALPGSLYLAHDPARPLWQRFPTVYFTADDAPTEAAPLRVDAHFDAEPATDFEGDLDAAVAALADWRDEGYRVLVTTHQVGRLRQVLGTRGVGEVAEIDADTAPRAGRVQVIDQRLAAGFRSPALGLAVLTDHELFGWRRSRTAASHTRAHRGSTALASLTELTPGDYVVHLHHGIGVYAGLVTRTVGEVERDYLQVDYDGSDRLFVPVTELDRLQKYIAGEGVVPRLNGLGDNRWKRTRKKAREKAERIARELLQLYAKRSQAPGIAFSADSKRQQAMEAAFIYEETPDQVKAIEAIKRDMEHAEPMDRLLCGDVGFGKTEVAVRAAFKAVEDRYQVAVLVPTTVLAQQHYATFAERMSAFGVKVEVLSRFRSRREQVEVLDGVRDGSVQVVIGTHRLLSEDIEFRNLGLLVIDEEQRFGVKHKEKTKELKLGVDVLTMTATPIPRTLNASLIGVRELSLLSDPPVGRLPVTTTVAERDDQTLREAILREMERDGQVYFLHNRVRSIERAAQQIERLVPTARIGIAHGQMPEDELEEVMVEMYAGRFDVLVCTSIIESGLDIPNVNTIIVDHCDQFGLAQLYQLIGRVGRRERQAYAYLLHARHKQLTPEAERRIEAICELRDLGSGFEIALRDLEIRGAGNLLGMQQSGFMEDVGYEMFTQMIAEALRILHGEEAEPEFAFSAEVELPVKANLPRFYVSDERQRIDLYRRLSQIRDPAQIAELEQEVRDRFGRLPDAARNLFRGVRIRFVADEAGLHSLTANGRTLVARFHPDLTMDAREMRIFSRALGRGLANGRVPKLKLSKDALTADLREPAVWHPLDAAEAVLNVILGARREVGAGAERMSA